MIERIGRWLAGPVIAVDGQSAPEQIPDLDERVEAIIGRVNGLEARVDKLEAAKQHEKPPREKRH